MSISGHFELIILQVKNGFACKCKRLKQYRNAVWNTMEYFDALNLTSIRREENNLVDKLEVVASTLQPSKELLNGDGKLEINFKPSVPDNMEHWQVFQSDEQIPRFLHNVEEFSNFSVNFQPSGRR